MNTKYKYIQSRPNSLRLSDPPKKPELQKQRIKIIDTFETKITLAELISLANKEGLSYESIFIESEVFYDDIEIQVYYYIMEENVNYKAEMLDYEEEMRIYNKEKEILTNLLKELNG